MKHAMIFDLAITKPAPLASKPSVQNWKERPLVPTRSSALQSVPATAEQKYRRGEFYLKIDGLTGPRTGRPVGAGDR